MSIRLTLIASASTTATRTPGFAVDEALDDRGLALAHRVAPFLPRPQRAWTSPALRARETAAALGLDAASESLLADADYGRWAGRTFDDIAVAEPDGLAAWIADPAAAPHGGESVLALIGRVGGWLDARRVERGHGLAVTHSAIIRAAVVHAIGAPPQCFWRLDIEPLSRTELRPHGSRWTLRSMGVVAQMPS